MGVGARSSFLVLLALAVHLVPITYGLAEIHSGFQLYNYYNFESKCCVGVVLLQ